MTENEAIKNIEDIKRLYTWSTGADDALDMAIEALKNQKGARGRMTNIEKLKAMTDEEIAKAVCEMTECKDCVGNDLCIQGDGEANGLIKWLQSEAVEDDE